MSCELGPSRVLIGLPAATPWYAFLGTGLGWEAHAGLRLVCALHAGSGAVSGSSLGCLGGAGWCSVGRCVLPRSLGLPALLFESRYCAGAGGDCFEGLRRIRNQVVI